MNRNARRVFSTRIGDDFIIKLNLVDLLYQLNNIHFAVHFASNEYDLMDYYFNGKYPLILII